MTEELASPTHRDLDARNEYTEARLRKCARVMYLYEKTRIRKLVLTVKLDEAFLDTEVVELKRVLLNWMEYSEKHGDLPLVDQVRMFILQNENLPRTLQTQSDFRL